QHMRMLAHLKRCPNGQLRMIRQADRGAEQRHDAVTDELVQRAVPLEDRLRTDVQIFVQHADVFLRLQPLRHRREAADVDEDDADVAALSADLDLLARSEHLVDNRLRNESAEYIRDASPFLPFAEIVADDGPYERGEQRQERIDERDEERAYRIGDQER